MRLLTTFQNLFDGQKYKHRNPQLGDFVALEFYEDLIGLGKSQKMISRISTHDRVINLKNITVGKKARRGDGTFGELVPSAVAIVESGFLLARGPTANIEIGAETKILAKAMIKQIDRVIGDLIRQVNMFKSHSGNPICVGFVGINFADHYTSYEGERSYTTNGKKHKHPIQEAYSAEQRLRSEAQPAFDEFLILKFRASNEEPFPFEWVDFSALN